MRDVPLIIILFAKKMAFEDGGDDDYAFTCKDEVEARKKCAELGRKVCGTCVSHLYKTD